MLAGRMSSILIGIVGYNLVIRGRGSTYTTTHQLYIMFILNPPLFPIPNSVFQIVTFGTPFPKKTAAYFLKKVTFIKNKVYLPMYNIIEYLRNLL